MARSGIIVFLFWGRLVRSRPRYVNIPPIWDLTFGITALRLSLLLSQCFSALGIRALGQGCSSNPIVCENALTGNLASEWDVAGVGDPTIQGFATDISVNKGQTINFKISTDATAYSIDIYRLGYYGGRGARKVATINPSVSLPQTQPNFRARRVDRS